MHSMCYKVEKSKYKVSNKVINNVMFILIQGHEIRGVSVLLSSFVAILTIFFIIFFILGAFFVLIFSD